MVRQGCRRQPLPLENGGYFDIAGPLLFLTLTVHHFNVILNLQRGFLLKLFLSELLDFLYLFFNLFQKLFSQLFNLRLFA